MSVFNRAKWIWIGKEDSVDEYGEFFTKFTAKADEKTLCRLSCDGDYTLFVNGNYVSSNQYGDFEHYKSYDELDITKHVKEGDNTLAVLVWHFGESTQRYFLAPAGLIFEVEQGGQVCVESNSSTLCRKSAAYKSGAKKKVSAQLGFSFYYDSAKEDDWATTGVGCSPAVEVEKTCRFVARPNKKLVVKDRVNAKILKSEGTYFLVDLGEEVVGLPVLEFDSQDEQYIRVDFGEDLQPNGHVRRLIHDRDFSYEYVAKKGKNEYVNYMLRLGCRYLEVYTEKPITPTYIGLLPQVYPTNVKKVRFDSELDNKIYELCVNSLQLCMMEHYVDCPWREQCLYAFDSRNQMLCGYYAFEDGNYEYARSNLLLMSEDRYPSGLMSICYPCGTDLTIPSFSLYYTLSVKEYMQYSGDVAFAKQVLPRIRKYLDVFLARKNADGLLYRFEGANNWNFYDWSEGSEGVLKGNSDVIPDAQMNILAVMALRALKDICVMAGLEYPYGDADEQLAKATYEAFYNKTARAFSVTVGGDEYVEIVNALAVTFGIVSGEEAKCICEKLANNELISCSLSMKCFK